MTSDSNGRTGRRQRGQAMAEVGIVVVLIVSLGMGIIEFGRVLMLLNMITHATRDAARAASVVNPNGRCQSDGDLSSGAVTDIQGMVTSKLTDVGLTSGITVTVARGTANGVPTITVTTDVSIPYIVLFNLVGSSLPVNKSVTFRDEFTTGSNTGC